MRESLVFLSKSLIRSFWGKQRAIHLENDERIPSLSNLLAYLKTVQEENVKVKEINYYCSKLNFYFFANVSKMHKVITNKKKRMVEIFAYNYFMNLILRII